jgi:hypothetical protein
MSTKFVRMLERTHLRMDQIASRTSRIHSALLAESKCLDAANFTRIHPRDLQRMFELYDALFFRDRIKECLGTIPLRFNISKRLTSSGGTTKRFRDRADPSRVSFEISVSSTLLFQCFSADDHRPIVSSGITCRDRLDTLQRTMEHELVHLIEMLLWNDSSCKQPRFHSITLRFFGHTEYRHQMITPRERALVKYGIRPGMRVRFRFEDRQHVGIVSRVTKRATVLVEDQHGLPYSDGKRYTKFYVPVNMLTGVSDETPSTV